MYTCYVYRHSMMQYDIMLYHVNHVIITSKLAHVCYSTRCPNCYTIIIQAGAAPSAHAPGVAQGAGAGAS